MSVHTHVLHASDRAEELHAAGAEAALGGTSDPAPRNPEDRYPRGWCDS